MFKIAQFAAAQTELAKRVTALEEMKNDPELRRELEFDAELESLLAKYSFNKSKLHAFLNSQHAAIKATEKKSANAEKGKTGHANRLWTNPHTGEKVVSRRRDHNTLLRWQEQYGLEAVLSWAEPM